MAGGPGWELCERVKGSLSYPINEIKDELENADLAIISNESSFVEGCSQGAGTTSFCGKPTYIQNLLDMGIDVVSLTGNHMNDYGRDYFTDTLDLYTENEIQYFASGKNSTEAWEPLIVQTDAGTIAFMGINRMGPDGVLATDSLAGTAYYVQETFLEKLDEVKDNVDIVWLDTHLWPEYGTTPTQEQVTITQTAIENGVDIVTGVSSHEPLRMTFYKGKPIFYGLGNFLFDQMWSEETRLGMVPKIHIYNGKIVNIEILPTRLYDYCQPRFLEDEDRTSVLEYFVGISEL
ncbi:MAG: CapA family protein [bacterium]